MKKLSEQYHQHPVLKHHFSQWERDKKAHREYRERREALKGKDTLFKETMRAGEKHYRSLCFACHGSAGQGTPMAGTSMSLAPPLKGSLRVLGKKDTLIKISLHGLMGPIDGKTYPGAMESLASNDNKYLSQVLTYIRNSWGNSKEMISEKDIATARNNSKNRKGPWTLQELHKLESKK